MQLKLFASPKMRHNIILPRPPKNPGSAWAAMHAFYDSNLCAHIFLALEIEMKPINM